MQTTQGVAEAELSEVASVPGQVEERIHSYMSRTEEGVSCTCGEATQQLEKEVQASASGVVATNTQQTQVLVGTVRGELQVRIETAL